MEVVGRCSWFDFEQFERRNQLRRMQAEGVIDELNVPDFVTIRKMPTVPGQQDVAAVAGGEGEVVRVAAAAQRHESVCVVADGLLRSGAS